MTKSRPCQVRLSKTALALLTVLVCALVVPMAKADDAPPFAKRITGYVGMKDGVKLRYSVLLPRQHGSFPVIMDYSGYASGSIGSPEVPADGRTATVDDRLLEAGYAVIGVNMRGTACSEGGPFVAFDPRWGTDGRTMVEWAAKQPWSNGRVGMANWSFNGLSQLWTAATRPPSLRAIAPGMVAVDTYRDVGYPGGIENYLFPTGWWQVIIKHQWQLASDAAQAEGDTRCVETVKRNIAQAEPTSPPALLKAHPFIDPFIRHHTLLGRTKRIDVPVLSMEDYQDEATGTRGGYYQETLDPEKTWYVGTNGRHNLYANNRFVDRTLLPYLDRFVKGQHNGFASRPKVQLWEDTVGSGLYVRDAQPTRVIRYKRFPPSTHPLRFNLRSGSRLTRREARPHEGRSSYDYPVAGPNVNDEVFGGAWDKLEPDWRKGSLAFTSPRLKHPISVWGSAGANLWVSSSAPDTDLQVTVTDVRPDGQEQYLQRGWLRLSGRKIKRRLSTSTRPVHVGTRSASAPVVPGKPVRARVEIEKFMHTFHRGSRIRIWVDAPSVTGEFGFTSLTDPAINKVWHDPNHRSRVVFGQLKLRRTIPAHPPCEQVYFEPCRSDPLPRTDRPHMRLNVHSKFRQPSHNHVEAKASCKLSDCTVVARALVRVKRTRGSGHARHISQQPVRLKLSEGDTTTVKVHLNRKTRKAVRAADRHRGKARARLRIRAKDPTKTVKRVRLVRIGLVG